MFKLIPGTLPKLTCARAIGVATGELTQAMFDIKLDLASPTPAYNMLFEVHHAVSRDKFFAVVSGPDCDGVRDAMDFLVGELRKVENEIEKCHALKLPESWIHGDLHYGAQHAFAMHLVLPVADSTLRSRRRQLLGRRGQG